MGWRHRGGTSSYNMILVYLNKEYELASITISLCSWMAIRKGNWRLYMYVVCCWSWHPCLKGYLRLQISQFMTKANLQKHLKCFNHTKPVTISKRSVLPLLVIAHVHVLPFSLYNKWKYDIKILVLRKRCILGEGMA